MTPSDENLGARLLQTMERAAAPEHRLHIAQVLRERLQELLVTEPEVAAVSVVESPSGAIQRDATAFNLPAGPGHWLRVELQAGLTVSQLQPGPAALASYLRLLFSSAQLAGGLSQRLGDAQGHLIRQGRTLNVSVAERRAVQAVQSQVLGALSHDLRGPIAIIQGNCQLLMEGVRGELSPGQLKTVGTVQRQTARLDKMVGDLLTSHEEAQAPPSAAVESLAQVLGVLVASYADVAALHQVSIELELGESAFRPALAPQVLEDALSVCLGAALSACAGTLRVSTTVQGTRATVSFTGQGGLSADAAPDPSTPALVAAVQQGCELQLHGELTFTIPAGRPQDLSRVLVVAQEPDQLDELVELLGHQAEVICAASESELAQHLSGDPPDAAVLIHSQGLNMPAIRALLGPTGASVIEFGLSASGASQDLPVDGPELLRGLGLSGQAGAPTLRRWDGGVPPSADAMRARLTRWAQQCQGQGRPLAALRLSVRDLAGLLRAHGDSVLPLMSDWLAGQICGHLYPGELLIQARSGEYLIVGPRSAPGRMKRLGDRVAEEVRAARPRLGASRATVTLDMVIIDLASAMGSVLSRTNGEHLSVQDHQEGPSQQPFKL